MFDPCGTRRLEGDDILKRLAEYLRMTPFELEEALIELVDKQRDKQSQDRNGGCPCGN